VGHFGVYQVVPKLPNGRGADKDGYSYADGDSRLPCRLGNGHLHGGRPRRRTAGDTYTDNLVRCKAAQLEVYIAEPEKTIRSIEQYKQQGRGRGVFSTLWNFGAARFNGATVSLLKLDIANTLANIWLCAVGLAWAVKYHTAYSIVYFTVVTIVICVFGGAICRCAALEFARGEKSGLTEAFRFSGAKLSSLLAAPFVPVGIMLLLGALVFFLGLMGNLPAGIGELITALGLAGALLIGLLLVFLLAGAPCGCI